MESLRDQAHHEETVTGPQSRADTTNDPDPYGLQLTAADLDCLPSVLGDETLHYVIGFLTGALTIPEPFGIEEWLEQDDETLDDAELFEDDADFEDDEEEDEDADEQTVASAHPREQIEGLRRKLFESVQQRLAAGALSSLIPHAQDKSACDEWLEGFDYAICQTLHDATPEEVEICGRLFDRKHQMGFVTPSRPKEPDRESLDAEVKRLIALWREVPPYDPEQEERRWSDVVPKRPELPKETIFHSGGTFVRSEAKVGRNELCPCGSGKKYKKCCA